MPYQTLSQRGSWRFSSFWRVMERRLVVTDLSKECVTFIFTGSRFMKNASEGWEAGIYIGKVWPVDVIGGEPTGRCGRWTLNPWRWRKNIPLKWSEPLSQQCSITIQKTRTSITLLWKSQNSHGYVARRPHQVTIQMSFKLQCKHNQNTKNFIW